MRYVALSLLLFATVARAQDVLTIGSGTGQQGGAVSIPVYVRDVSGTALGVDLATGSRIQGFAFKVFFSTDVVASVTIARAGVAAARVPMYENSLQGSGWSAFIASFKESTDLVPFVSNQALPGNQIAVLTVTLQPAAVIGTTSPLTFDAPSATLSNQAGTARETVSSAALTLANGSVSVIAGSPLATPASLNAAATSSTTVSTSWTGVAGAHHYEIFRSFNGGGYALVAISSVASYSETASANTAYLYRVRAVDATGGASSMSNLDLATTVTFTDDPKILFDHFAQLRTAVNAVRASAKLGPMAADATFAAGALIRAQHMIDLRNAIAEARSTLALPPPSFGGGITAGQTPISLSPVNEIRAAVQ